MVDAEISKVETANRAAYERVGAVYEPGGDLLLCGLHRWRDCITETFTPGRALRPEQLKEFFGEVRPAKKLFG